MSSSERLPLRCSRNLHTWSAWHHTGQRGGDGVAAQRGARSVSGDARSERERRHAAGGGTGCTERTHTRSSSSAGGSRVTASVACRKPSGGAERNAAMANFSLDDLQKQKRQKKNHEQAEILLI